MKEDTIQEIENAITDPVFWKKWNYPEGREIRKKIVDLISDNRRLKSDNKHLIEENDYLRADNNFLQK